MNDKLTKKKKNKSKGFTLIEVVIGISICTILFGICHGVITKYLSIYNYHNDTYRLEYETYWIYRTFDNLINNYNKNLSEIKIEKKGNLPETAIYEDYYTDDIVITYFKNNTIQMLYYNNNGLIRLYEIEELYGLIVNQTFYLIITDKKGNIIEKVYYLCEGS